MSSESPQKKKKILIASLIGLLVLLAIGIGSYFLFKSKAPKNINPEEAPVFTDATAPDSTYYVIVGSYEKEEYASRHAERNSSLDILSLSDEGTFRVKSLEFHSFEEAFEEAQSIRTNDGVKAWVLPVAK